MDEAQASEILLICSVESHDRDGALLPVAERARASRDAGVPTEGADDLHLARRASLLIPVFESKAPELASTLRAIAARRSWPGLVVVGACLLAGFATHGFGDTSTINVLAFPLLGLMAWNLAVFAILLGARLRGRGSPGGLARLIESFAARMFGRKLPDLGARDGGLRARVARDFVARWTGATARTREARLRAILHLAAAALVLGTVGGMYWDGVAHAYKAKWESTFITRAETAKGFFDALFGPASALTGIRTPNLEEIEQARLGEGGAARWIHLYAVTVGLAVVLPRLWLAGLAAFTAGRFRRALGIEALVDASYRRRTLAAPKGGNALAVVVGHRLPEIPPPTRDAVRTLAHGLWGGALVVEFSGPVEYGGEDAFLSGEPIPREPEYLVYLAPLSTTPEEESQGRLVSGLRDRLAASDHGRAFLVVLDPAEFAARLDGMPEMARRLTERRQAWNRLLAPRGLACVVLGDADDAAAAAVWEPEPVAGGEHAG